MRRATKGVVIWLVIGAALLLLLHSNREGTDLKHYLAWTRSLAFDRDILLINDFEVIGETILLTPTGYAVELHNVGTALLWLPFYTLAHGVVSLLALPTDGIEPPYRLAINFSASLYGLLGLLLTYLTVRRFFSKKASWWAVGLVGLGSPLFYYTTSLPMNSHLPAFFLAALFLYLWTRYREAYDRPRVFTLGVLTGWLALVANNNIALALLPLTDWFYDPVVSLVARLVRRQSQPLFPSGPARTAWLVAVYGLGAGLAFTPQLIVWRSLYGSPFASPYARQLLWLQPQLWETLFSPFHGLFVYSPILLLSVAGFFCLMRRDRRWGAASVLAWGFLTYVNASNISWWAGSSFGGRLFLVLTPLFIVGLAALFDRLPHWSLYLLGNGCAAWTFLLFLQTVGGLMNLHNYYPFGEMVSGQWQALSRLPQLLPAYLASFRSSSGDWSGLQNPAGLSLLALWVIFFIVTMIALRWVYRWAAAGRPVAGRYGFGPAVVLPVGLALFFILTAWRGDQARRQLQQSGFYDTGHVVTTIDFFDLVGLYSKRAGYNLKLGRPAEAQQDVFAAAQVWPDHSRTLITETDLNHLAPHRLDLNYSNILRLVGYRLETGSPPGGSPSVRAGSTVPVQLFWQRLAGRAGTVNSVVRLLDSQGQTIGQGSVARGLGPFPAERILDGMYFYDTIPVSLEVAGQFPALARLQVSLPEDAGPPVTGDGSPHDGVVGLVEVLPSDFAGETAFEPVSFNLGGQISLTGYRLSPQPLLPGDTLQLALMWQAQQPLNQDYTIFVHLLDETDTLYAQSDKQPLAGTRPTTSWPAGEKILDEFILPLPPELAAGQYRLDVGLYLFSTGERLMLLNDRGDVIDSRIKLATVTIDSE